MTLYGKKNDIIGVTAPLEQIQNRLNALVKFNGAGNEAKRNEVRSLAKGAGVDPVAAFKAGSTPVHISEIKFTILRTDTSKSMPLNTC
ncbi:MAG: hypothetical protein WC556_01490 [Candidatus Methanoperedens sp.]